MKNVPQKTPSTENIPDMWTECTVMSLPERQVQMFVIATIFRCLTKCKALATCSNDGWLRHARHLVDQINKGLSIPDGFDLDLDRFNMVAKAVLERLTKTFGNLVKYCILMPDPDITKMVVQCFHVEIDKEIVRQKKFFETKERIFSFIFHHLRTSILAGTAGILTLCATIISAWLITLG